MNAVSASHDTHLLKVDNKVRIQRRYKPVSVNEVFIEIYRVCTIEIMNESPQDNYNLKPTQV